MSAYATALLESPKRFVVNECLKQSERANEAEAINQHTKEALEALGFESLHDALNELKAQRASASGYSQACDALCTENDRLQGDLQWVRECRRVELDRYRRKVSGLDCRETGAGLADFSGSHCPPGDPCDRCKHEAEEERLRGDVKCMDGLASKMATRAEAAEARLANAETVTAENALIRAEQAEQQCAELRLNNVQLTARLIGALNLARDHKAALATLRAVVGEVREERDAARAEFDTLRDKTNDALDSVARVIDELERHKNLDNSIEMDSESSTWTVATLRKTFDLDPILDRADTDSATGDGER